MTGMKRKSTRSKCTERQPLKPLTQCAQREPISRVVKRRATTGQMVAAGEHPCKRRRSERLMKSNKAADGSNFDLLPDEMVSAIFQHVDDETRMKLKATCVRFCDLILGNTNKLDHKNFTNDPSVVGERSAYDLILSCPRLKILSLIKNPCNNITKPILNGPLSYSMERMDIAKQLALRCKNIRIVDVASIQALRLIKDYVRCLGGSSQLTELRVYSSEIRQLAQVMLEIVKCSPKLTVFKLLRRTYQKKDALLKDENLYNQLWTLMGRQLTSFSTNVNDRSVLANCCSQMVHVQRIVIWHLDENEVFTLATHCQQLRIVILMNCSLGSFKHLVHLPNMVELTFHIKPTGKIDASDFCQEFTRTFAVIGKQLTSLSLVMKDVQMGDLLSSMPLYCTNLHELRLKEINKFDYNGIYKMVRQLPALTFLYWMDCKELNNPDFIGKFVARKMFRKSMSLEKIFTTSNGESIFYSPSKRNTESREEDNENYDEEDFS